MPLDDAHAWALLRELDDADPDFMEIPRGYDHAATRARFEQLVVRLNRRFGCHCVVDREAQDCSHHGTIVLPAEVTTCRGQVVVTISNFGNLAAVTVHNAGDLLNEEHEVFHADRDRIEAELDALGYVSIPARLLKTKYDGVSELASYHPPSRRNPVIWWTRFFDYQ
ncbi:hypothetical protein [Embleya sp. AB8]|uniref:hypothetical protein n=1 Tax=Embleya sp. AB8 TaxID=3156304 RepID=UPI003C75B0E0